MISLAHPRTWALWDFIFPPICAVCGHELVPQDILFCRECWTEAPIADMRDLHKLHHVDMAFAAYSYSAGNIAGQAVRDLKYSGMTKLARVMAEKMLLRMPLKFAEHDVTWVPVPLHWRRRLARGFNQSIYLAKELAVLTDHDLMASCLRRVKATPSQTAQKYRERAANVKNAFTVRSPAKLPTKILLFDDVITTGATIDECARTLKAAGAEWVGAFSFSLTHSR
jgi:competence protein ComFC